VYLPAAVKGLTPSLIWWVTFFKVWPMWAWKVGQVKNPGIMLCIFTSCAYDKFGEDPASSSGVIALFFGFGPLVAKSTRFI
jgi:hypothetical protein